MRKILAGLIGIGMYAVSFAGVVGFDFGRSVPYAVKDSFDETVSVIERPFKSGMTWTCVLGIDNNGNGIISVYDDPFPVQVKITGRPTVYKPEYFVQRSFRQSNGEWRGIIDFTPEDREFLKQQQKIELRAITYGNRIKKYELKK